MLCECTWNAKQAIEDELLDRSMKWNQWKDGWYSKFQYSLHRILVLNIKRLWFLSVESNSIKARPHEAGSPVHLIEVCLSQALSRELTLREFHEVDVGIPQIPASLGPFVRLIERLGKRNRISWDLNDQIYYTNIAIKLEPGAGSKDSTSGPASHHCPCQ